MAQRKAKNEKQLGSGSAAPDGSALVLEYLRKQNRPYSATEVSVNLHNKITKAHAAKALRELHQNKQIEGRAAGKQIVYHALQETSTEVTPEIIAALDEQAEKLQEQVTSLEAAEKNTRVELATICARPLLSELRRDVGQFEQEHEAIRARLVQARGSDAGTVPVQVKVDAERDWKHWQNQAKVRGRICRDLWRMCSEVVPDNMGREELWENLGLEGPFLQ
ncbi:putative TBP interacting domain protein [Aspergillus tubingensis]|uniref:Homologous-pairing protein 2 winged helix domain-containing protein n=1 Tax=Aspergillus tubingensis (strain CBS 134.48) TaxID=767770 RepID=A0A1L9N2D9_ASPTC|nr:spindle poison sensitivity protein Scp3 [Aspergillus tubingensis]OJI83449.1 hypothetical protein ASPTUDRAFT_722977 [Aspergillus tubingensis CBS 134.48]GFN17464.1 spindle poison sensitivity protein Scp3 [Aspergillus tubingensis]